MLNLPISYWIRWHLVNMLKMFHKKIYLDNICQYILRRENKHALKTSCFKSVYHFLLFFRTWKCLQFIWPTRTQWTEPRAQWSVAQGKTESTTHVSLYRHSVFCLLVAILRRFHRIRIRTLDFIRPIPYEWIDLCGVNKLNIKPHNLWCIPTLQGA